MGPQGKERRHGNRRQGDRREGDRRERTVLDEELCVEEDTPERKAQFAKARSTVDAWAALDAERAEHEPGRRLCRRRREA
jgi:hypothetical protein